MEEKKKPQYTIKEPRRIFLDPANRPRVLFLGNGMTYSEETKWEELLKSLNQQFVIDNESVIEQIPNSMRPEAFCGTDVEAIRQKVVAFFQDKEPCIKDHLKRILSLDFDCIITTNYTYEIEEVLSGGWTDSKRNNRRESYDENASHYHNTYTCYSFKRKRKAPLQVWHPHGDLKRSQALTLSYYSYADRVLNLKEYNKRISNKIAKSQEDAIPYEMKSWFDWFLIGDVYMVGFGFDFCEFDIWWALERKSREKGDVGKLFFYNAENKQEQDIMLKRMGAEIYDIRPREDIIDKSKRFEQYYNDVIDDIEKRTLKNSI